MMRKLKNSFHSVLGRKERDERVPLLQNDDANYSGRKTEQNSTAADYKSGTTRTASAFKQLFSDISQKEVLYLLVAFVCAVLHATLPALLTKKFGPYLTLQIDFQKLILVNQSISNLYDEIFHNPLHELVDDLNQAQETLAQKLLDSASGVIYFAMAIAVAVVIFATIQRILFIRVASGQQQRLRLRVADTLMHLSIEHATLQPPQQLIASLEEDLATVWTGRSESVCSACHLLCQVAASLTVSIMLRPTVAFALLPLAPAMAAAAFWHNKHTIKIRKREQHALSKAAGVSGEAFESITTVLAYNAQWTTLRRYTDHMSSAAFIAKKYSVTRGAVDGFVDATWSMVFVFGIWYGALTMGPDDLLGDLFVMCFLMSSVCAALSTMLTHVNRLQLCAIAIQNLNRTLQQLPVEPSKSLMKRTIERQGISVGPSFSTQSGKLQLCDISFAYKSRPQSKVLRNVNISVMPGEQLAIVGASGSGKSTLAKLLLRLIDPTEGEIYFDDQNVLQRDHSWMRNQIGYVAQEPVLFDTTIKENILCGNPQASEQDLNRVMLASGCADFVRRLPNGADTVVGARGGLLSGGEKQRVAIARAIIREPRLLILDEATSALDQQTQQQVMYALNNARSGCTTVVIAHRASAVTGSNRVVVLNKGVIVETGPTDQLLMDTESYFAKMVQSQGGSLSTSTVPHPETVGTPSQGGSQSQSLYSDPSTAVRRKKRSGTGSIVSQSSAIVVPLFQPTTELERLSSEDENDNEQQSLMQIEKMIPSKYKRSEYARWILSEMQTGLLIAACVGLLSKAIGIVAWILTLASQLEALTLFQQQMVEQELLIGYVWLVLGTIKWVVEIGAAYGCVALGETVALTVRVKVLTHCLRQNLSYFHKEEHKTHVLNTRLGTDSHNLKKFISDHTLPVFGDLFAGLLALALAFAFNAKYAAVCSACYAVMIVIPALDSVVTGKHEAKLRPIEDKLSAIFLDSMSNLATVKAYALETQFLCEYELNLSELYSVTNRCSITSSIVYGAQAAALYLFYAIALASAANWIVARELSFGSMWAVSMLAQISCFRLVASAARSGDLRQGWMSGLMLYDILQEDVPFDAMSKDGLTSPIIGNLVLQDVTVCHPGTSTPVLQNMNLSINKGRMTALVGMSGCGKSTICSLITRLIEPTSGIIILDGHDIKDYNIAHLRRNIVLVSQEPVLLSVSIWENVAFGLEQHEVSHQQLVNACKQTFIHDQIVTLQMGYQTQAGHLGGALSGGEKQRIALARALIRHPKILVLDEATSALDQHTQQLVMASVNELVSQGDCACVCVAHRLSTIRHASSILLIRQGKVVENGWP